MAWVGAAAGRRGAKGWGKSGGICNPGNNKKVRKRRKMKTERERKTKTKQKGRQVGRLVWILPGSTHHTLLLKKHKYGLSPKMSAL